MTIVHINPFSTHENYYPAMTCLDNHKLKTIEAGVMTYRKEEGELRSRDFFVTIWVMRCYRANNKGV